MYRTLSWRNIPNARTLFAMVFMAGIGLIISIVALLYLSLHLISTKTNEIDEHRTALSVQGSIQTSVNRVSSLVLDNAVWDDAVREAYRPTLDTDWLYNTWGTGFKINNLYDGTFVLDEHFNVLWGSFQSRPFNEKTSTSLVKASKRLSTSTGASLRAKKYLCGDQPDAQRRGLCRHWADSPDGRQLTGPRRNAPLSGDYPPSERQNIIRPGRHLSDR
jgi:sensor domain CHASE-containing protein